MPLPTDIRPCAIKFHLLPVETRVPLKFGAEVLTHVVCLRVCVKVQDRQGRAGTGWGETPLSVQWGWPSPLPYEERYEAMVEFCRKIADALAVWEEWGHAMEVGHSFIAGRLPSLQDEFNAARPEQARLPHLAALICCSAFDIALHDAFGNLHGVPVYETYRREWMNRDLASFLEPALGADVRFDGQYPADFLSSPRPDTVPVWHLVGGKDPVDESELEGDEPRDGYPVLLRDWIEADGLKCLKVKLRGTDGPWDYDRLVKVGRLAIETGVDWLTTDFNCTVTEPDYVNSILDRLMDEHPRIYGMILYVEQPFPYDLEKNRIDVHSLSARKPLFMDESAHDWRLVRLGRELGWTGVALKTCKTQTGALLSLCWAKAHGMTLMVQDLTNPMIAQIPHVLLGAYAGTIRGVESNGMQFYPEASLREAEVHPGLYKRNRGVLDLSTIEGPGFGYRLEEIQRDLPEAAHLCGDW
jgi:L-alanine-DL-glutamate epimerase-like enolase superfamily enzyme